MLAHLVMLSYQVLTLTVQVGLLLRLRVKIIKELLESPLLFRVSFASALFNFLLQ